ncbi:MAG: dethiobiotin synthase [Candidatus Aureabacteria bacterium]|nr:dethiobiotin synthase [Candidatus Auribacterota bacterium]
MTARGLFITGTDTGVGKTVVTALLAHLLRREGFNAGVMKPVASGGVMRGGRCCSPDALFLKEMLGLDDPIELLNPVCFSDPLAPSVAAAREGRAPDCGVLDRALYALRERHDLLLVEGIGGLLVPLGGKFTVADLAVRWEMPLLVVGRPGLGTINHTALTIAHARTRGLRVAGFIFNACSPGEGEGLWEENAASIRELAGAPFWGMVPYGGGGGINAALFRRLAGDAETILGPPLRSFVRDT